MNKITKTYAKISIIVIIIAITLGYAYYQTQDYIKGPLLELTAPINGSTHQNDVVIIKGNAQNISYISLNGRQIFTDQSGNFSETILLAEGYNLVKVSVQDKYKREVQKILELVYQPPQQIKTIIDILDYLELRNIFATRVSLACEFA